VSEGQQAIEDYKNDIKELEERSKHDSLPGKAFFGLTNWLGSVTGIPSGDMVAKQQIEDHQRSIDANTRQLQEIQDTITRALPLVGKSTQLPPPKADPSGTMPAESDGP
jgi:hypothetical protein